MKHSSRDRRYLRSRGFTLIEVMVAMLIVAMALPALLDQTERLAEYTFVTRAKTQAYWVAQNRMTEIRLEYRLNGTLPDRKESDTVELGRDKWTWTVTTEELPDIEALRVDIEVAREGQESTLASLTGFIRGE